MHRIKSEASPTAVFRLALFIFAVFLMASHICAGHSMAAQATLSWDPTTTYADGSPLTAVGGYRVHAGTAPGSYSQNINVGNVNSYTFTTLNDATTYYFAVTAYDTAGLASAFSNELLYTTPTPPPAVPVYTLSASAGAGGSITPAGSLVLSQGMSQSFSITPATGYRISAVTVDGVSVGAVTTYAFSNVTANHTIQATFVAAGSTLKSFAANSGGAAFTDATGLIYGADSAFSGGSAAKTTAAIGGTTDDTLYQSERYGNFSYSIPVANGNYSLTLKFAEIYFSAAGQRVFSVTVNGQTVISNLDIYAKVGKNVAYDVVIPINVTTGAVTIGFTSTRDYGKISAIKISPSAGIASYGITASAGTGGTISPAGTTTVTGGSSQTYTIIPGSGYKISAVTVDGTSVGAVSTYTFSNVTANHTIAAAFVPTTSAVLFAVNSGGARFTDSTGAVYQADGRFSGGSSAKTTATIAGTTNDVLYQSERWGNFSYTIPAANGNYLVTLKFAEIYFSAAGRRVFNVAINGQTVISNLDIYAKVGKNVAYDVVIPVTATNGAITVKFTSTKDYGKVSAILVKSM
ncbi:malectin domain-containing carbohydrate-binding protein [Geotalea toluenoxydans]